MKRLLALAVVFLCCVATSFAQFSGSGSGTENDPYLILNPIQLNQLRNFLNQEGVYFKLMADIDLTEFLEDENPDQGWQPIGTSSAPFKGILDGNGKTISGFWINRNNTDNVGFFGCTNGATIKNLMLEGGTIKGKNNVGLLIGLCSLASISSCRLSGNIIGISNIGGTIGSCGIITISNIQSSIFVSGEDNTGGLIGMANVGGGINDNISITNCRISSDIINGNNYVGGICGALNGWRNVVVENCFVYTDISGNDYVGGIIGKQGIDNNSSEGTHINHAVFAGNISGNTYVGGIVGAFTHKSYYNIGNSKGYETHNHPSIQNCVATGTILGKNDYVGGIIGNDVGYYYQSHLLSILNLVDNYFTGSIKGNDYVGGIVGSKFMGWIHNCYSSASISGKDNVGGICGNLGWTGGFYPARLKSCMANNTYLKANGNSFGRIYGFCQSGCEIGNTGTSAENKSYNRTIVINKGVALDVTDDKQNGTGVSATTLKLKATYVAMGWDFTDTWAIQETECYPYFKSQTAPPVITSQVVSGATTISGKCIDGGLITLEIDGVTQQMTSTGNNFSFNVSPLQAGHEVRICAKAEGKEQSYFATELVSYLGSGTELDPYQIYTASDLTGVYRKGYFKLMNNIDLTDYINQFSPTEGWQSIGRDGSETIHFDGNGHKITGLWCNSARDNTGLFSCFANGNIKDLTVETAAGKQVKGGANTGILIGKMINGTIENCKVTGTVADGTPVGGMVGLFDGGEILKCQASVSINTTASTTYAGGLVGEITGGEINQCYTDGSLTTSGNESYAGGLVGKNSGTITNSYSSAAVASSYNAAGLVAYNFGVVDKCMASGNLYCNNYAAGVIGYNDGAAAVISNSVALNNKIEITYESQQIQQGGGYGQRIIGGIKNNAPAPEMNNYALKTMQVSVNDVAQKVYDDIMNGAGKTGAELMKKTTYQSIGWDFTDIWSISEGESYPALKNNEASVISGDNTDDDTGINTLLGVDLQTLAGSKVVLSINLNNEDEVKLCQFDLQLPNGVTVATKSNGKLDAKLTERAETHSISSQQLSNGNYRFIISSMDNDSFTGNSGTLVEITLDIPATMEAGEYTVKLLNAELSVPDGTDLKVVKPADTESKLIVKAYTPGDVNNDGSVSVTDVGCAINYILEQVPSVFIFDAADMNGDKTISVTDVGMIINLILNEGSAVSRKLNRTAAEDAYFTQQRTTDGYLLQLDNKDAFIGFQMDLQVANGATIKSMKLIGGDDHLMTYRQLDNGIWRVICYSLTNSTFVGNEADLLNISTTGDVSISNIRLTTSDLNEVCVDGISAGTTGIIDRFVNQNEELKVYTLDGRLCRVISRQYGENPIDGLKPGIYMIDNRKVVVR